MSDSMRLLSFGGGVQTTALSVLLVRGEIDAQHIVMADTEGETPETYRHVALMADYLAKHGHALTIVREHGINLEEWTLTRSTPIPIRTETGLGHRQCTGLWKIRPIKRYARQHGAKRLAMILGISSDEVSRIKPDQEKWVHREYPLVDMLLNREDCRRIVSDAGLPDPPRSACFYCPLQGSDRWRWLNAEHPDLFARAEAMETAINARSKAPAFLTTNLKPLHNLITAGAMLPGFEAEECEGVCFV